MNLFHKRSTLYFLLSGTITMIFIMIITGRPLTTANTPSGIINLELACTHTKVQVVLSSWNNDIIAAAKINTYFDFLFLVFYALFLYSCCIQLAKVLPQEKSISKWLNKFAIASVIAGFLDILENTGMLISLAGNGSERIALFTATFSLIKWLLVIFVLLLIIVGFMVKLNSSRKQEG